MSPSSPSRLKRQTGAPRRPARKSAAKKSTAGGGRAGLELETLQEFRTIFASARRHDAEVRQLARISGSQLWALSEIARSGGMRVNDLAERMALHQTTSSNLVNALVERKLVQRARDEEDARVVRLHVTTEGKRLLLRAPGPYTGLLVDALRRLDAAELNRLRKSLAVLSHLIRNAATDAAGETLLGD
ncbi:MAG TPA: MarR family winged helix-turn-helix transcriptional regulator [Steroidobacteraceae bacterium]|jgi:DNA-binding MarR family transcriptional regulator|nr:MarR family winged helix-turn-helix transcriptional regulator [Steroidobacteraceae bacterium]